MVKEFFLNRPTFLKVMKEYRVARYVMAHGVFDGQGSMMKYL